MKIEKIYEEMSENASRFYESLDMSALYMVLK